ncbi:hypothetical protein GQR58_006681 [Nymphon striatum]|nr:hypothetical protein GQR58_006681 [Nymphon striatum]
MIIDRILTSQKKRLFGSKPIYEPYKKLDIDSINEIQNQENIIFPQELISWYLKAGFGDINEVFSLRKEWLSIIDRGELKNHVIFAQDDLGNFFSFSQVNGEINYICRHEYVYALLATNFLDFLSNLEKQSFNLQEIIDNLDTASYDWGV